MRAALASTEGSTLSRVLARPIRPNRATVELQPSDTCSTPWFSLSMTTSRPLEADLQHFAGYRSPVCSGGTHFQVGWRLGSGQKREVAES